MPRPVTSVEADWLGFLLPDDRPGYSRLRAVVAPLVVLGEGRWGEGDLVLGRDGQSIDLDAGMEPVAAFGGIRYDHGDMITLTLHQPDDEGRVEFQIGGEISAGGNEISRWSYSYWSPGDPCPSTGAEVREVELVAGDLLLAISPAARSLWLFDSVTMTNRLLPITNFYNELVMSLGIRDPRLALDHSRLFVERASFSDSDLRAAFIRYNAAFRKVDPDRLAAPVDQSATPKSLRERLSRIFGGGGR